MNRPHFDIPPMKTNHITRCLLILISTCIQLITSAQTFQWSNRIGSDLGDYGRSGVCDEEGNFYYAGIFEGLYCYFQTDTLVRHGINDLFLVKYGPSGNELWVRQIGGENEWLEESIAVYYDPVSKSIFIAGDFSGTVSFGSCTLTASGGLDIFLAKYDLKGNCKWAKKAGGESDDECYRLAFDNPGNLYMCGTTLSSSFNGFIIQKGGFLAKFDAEGNCLWAKNKIAWAPYYNSQIQLGGLKVFNSDIFLSGCTQVDDTIRIDSLVIAHKGLYSSLVCCFDSTGTAKWIREGISRLTETISDIDLDKHGNIFHTGNFVDSIKFNGNVLISGHNHREMFLVKYDKTGTVKWIEQSNSSYYSDGYNLAAGSNGTVFITGDYYGLTQFGNYAVGGKTGRNMFLAGYDSLGTCLGAYHFESGYGTGVALDSEGNLFFTFLFNPSTSLGSSSYTSYGGTDIILAKCSAITGIGGPEPGEEERLLIFANPTTGKCTVTLPTALQHEKDLVLRVFDSGGRQVGEYLLDQSAGKIKLNVEALAQGIYQVVVSGGGKVYSGKVVFKK